MALKPFLAGKKTSETPSLRPAQASAAGAHAHRGDDNADPTVEVVKEGGKVVRLVVTCTCGERIEVECLYPAGS